MESSAVSNLGSIGAIAASIATPVTLLTLAVFIRLRTGSFITVFARLWTLFHGKPTGSLPFVRTYLENQSSVMQLNFATGAKIRTEQHAKRVLDWCERHDESLDDARRCGPHFDWEAPGLKAPFGTKNTRKYGVSISILLFFFVVGVGMLALTSYDKAWLRLKATGTSFSFNDEAAQRLWSDKRLLFSQCGSVANARESDHGFTSRDAKIICDIFASGTSDERLAVAKKTLSEQRGAALSLATLSFIMMTPPFIVLVQRDAANAMQRRLRKRARNDPSNDSSDGKVNAA